MELAFRTETLRSLCEDEELAEVHLGEAVAAVLRSRLADLGAAGNLADLPIGPRAPGEPDDSGVSVIDLTEGFCIVLGANHQRNPTDPKGAIDWPRVRRLLVLDIRRDGDEL